MSSTLSARHESSQRSWWPLSSKTSHPSKDISRSLPSEKQSSRKSSIKLSTAFKFNPFASVMGFKSKRHPSLAIQEPPLSIRTDLPSPPAIDPLNRPQTVPYDTKLPLRSMLPAQSPVDSLEPRTPSDCHREVVTSRQSLLTLFDVDPSRLDSFPHPLSDPSALPPYSSFSAPDYVINKNDLPVLKRSSSASSSHSNHDDDRKRSSFRSVVQPTSVSEKSHSQKLRARKSTGSFRRKPSLLSTEDSLISAWESLTNAGNPIPNFISLSTLTENTHSSQADHTSLPCCSIPARSVGEGETRQPSAISRNQPLSPTTPSPTSPTSARIVKVQASKSRIGLPLSAPPAHDLPPPPPPPIGDALSDGDSEILVPDPASASSSSLSFASSVSSNKGVLVNGPYRPRQKEKKSQDPNPLSTSPTEGDLDVVPSPTSSKTSEKATTPSSVIAKSLPPHSLNKTGPADIPSVPISSDEVTEQIPRKQRSFHHSRMPLAMPLRHTSSFSPPSLSASMSMESTSIIEQKRGSGSRPATPSKKRLFSAQSLRRPSNSQCTMWEDETRSLSSLSPDHEGNVGPSFPKAFSSTTSSLRSCFWEEVSNDHAPPSSPHSTAHEYTPQRIMSPAEMLKVEASVQESDIRIRPRGLSLVSVSTTASGADGLVRAPLSASSPSTGGGQSTRHSNSLMSRAESPLISSRPSTSPANMTSPTGSAHFPLLTSSSQPVITGLPPPPRPRPNPPTSPLDQSHGSSIVAFIPLSPPVRTSLRMKFSRDVNQRQSILRKPSFLDIEDENDKEIDLIGQPLNDSFLDLARESFDTVRSLNR